jgi:hypothetical protein
MTEISCSDMYKGKREKGGRDRGETHDLQAPPAQDPLRGSHHIPPIPLQIPHDTAPGNLGEHLLDTIDVSLAGAR